MTFKVLEEEKGEGRKEEKGKRREDGDDYNDYPFPPSPSLDDF